MQQILAFIATGLLVLGLIGQGFELRKMRTLAMRDKEVSSQNMFANKRNFKWYAIIGAGLIMWFISVGFTR